MILLENLSFAYDGIYSALDGVSLQIDDGERIKAAIKGADGKRLMYYEPTKKLA